MASTRNPDIPVCAYNQERAVFDFHLGWAIRRYSLSSLAIDKSMIG